eukprot:g14039.t1
MNNGRAYSNKREYEANKQNCIIEFAINTSIAISDFFYFCCNGTGARWKEDKTKPGHGPEVIQTLRILGISSVERDLLYTLFKEIDFHNRDEIYMKAFMKKFHLESSPFTKKLFQIFDDNGSGGVDFLEFVTTLWNLCTFSNQGLKNCCFKIFDADSSGILDNQEIIELLKALWGDRYSSSRVARRVGKKLEKFEGEMNVQQFRVFVSKYKSIIQPLEKIRDTLRRQVLGEEYWKRMEKRRSSIIEQMSKEALASAHEMSIGGTHNFCIAGGADDCITHKHPTHDRRKKKRPGGKHGNHFIKKKKTAPRSDSFNRQVEAEKQSMRLLHTVLWTEGVELPVTKIFKWALSSSSIPPIKRKVIVTKEKQNDATRNGDEGLSRIRERKRKENLQMEVSAAFHRIQLIRNHHFEAAKAHEFITQYKVNEARKADVTPPRRKIANKENVPKTKSRFYKDREAEAKKRNKKSKKRSKKYALDASINTNLGRNLTYTVTGASKDTGKRNRPRSARPTSAKRRI